MTPHVITVHENSDVAEVARLMLETGIKSIPVVQADKVVGMISRSDVIHALATTDARIRDEIVALLREAGLHTWTISVDDGDVSVFGPDGAADRRLVDTLARTARGVRSVHFVPTAARPCFNAAAVGMRCVMDEPRPDATEVLGLSDCWRLLRGAPVGRLALTRGDQPEIFPVNFVVDHASIVFRTQEGTKLTFSLGRRVAFEADGYDAESGEAWSVVVKGKAWEVSQLHEVLDALELPLFPWHATPKGHVIRIEPDEVSPPRAQVPGEPDKSGPSAHPLGRGAEDSLGTMDDAQGPVRVFLLDDHEVVRRGIGDLLDAEPDLEIVGEAGTAREALARIPALKPHVAVLDVRLPDGDGVTVCREIRSTMPSVACLMLTSFADDEALFDAIMAGAAGYVLKQVRGTDLVGAIRTVASGGSMLDANAASQVMAKLRAGAEHADPLAVLSAQERKILDLIGEGLTNRQIGERMFLAEKTVKNYVSSLLAKLGMERRVQAAVYATQLKQGEHLK